jgi:hypothetical protein
VKQEMGGGIEMLEPLARFMSDIGKIMFEDDKLDFAFPNRAHSGFAHHWKWGMGVHIAGSFFSELLGIYKVVKTEQYKTSDTPQTFLKRVISIHKKTYDPHQEAQEERLRNLISYFNGLGANADKAKIEREFAQFMYRNIPKDVIYRGKLRLAGDRNMHRDGKRTKTGKSAKPPKLPPPARMNKIQLYKK